MNVRRDVLLSVALIVLSTAISAGMAEVLLRIKNASMSNYDIEMWRYANLLKRKSADPALDFDHRRLKSAILENTEIRLNEWGLRGPPVEHLAPGARRILFLGGSITLGWGVPEDETVEARLQRMLRDKGQKVQVLNGGVGNYNAERYVSRFFKELTPLNPTDIVVQYFLRDAEDLEPGGGNVLLRHSELAVTLWIAYHRLFYTSGEHSLEEHYRRVYEPNQRGFVIMQEKLKQLANYAKVHNIRIYLAMTPDVHNLIDYKLAYIHDIMRNIARGDGYTYVDLLPAMRGQPAQDLFAMPGDPHPNALGHRLMADAILPVVADVAQVQETAAH